MATNTEDLPDKNIKTGSSAEIGDANSQNGTELARNIPRQTKTWNGYYLIN